ncbi:MAG: hypothetical protein AAF322_02935 [Pseudomonadota bacterium]
MERTLYLHIGHGKTGSSYLQTCFALSRGALRRARIDYVFHESFDRARRGGITSGNGDFAAPAIAGRFPAALRRFLAARRAGSGGIDALLSYESLFDALMKPGAEERLKRLAARGGFSRVRILLFIRDPFEHLSSIHQQWIKRHGRTEGINETARRYGAPFLVAGFIRRYAGLADVELTVRNYSRRRGEIAEVAEAWLGVPEGALDRPDQPTVNRTLTLAELEVQRLLNRHFGASSRLAADPLAERLPHIAAERPLPGPVVSRAMAKRLAAPVKEVNAFVGPDDAYRLEPPDVGAPRERLRSYRLSGRQLEVLIDAFAAEIKRRPLRF